MFHTKTKFKYWGVVGCVLVAAACNVPKVTQRAANTSGPENFTVNNSTDSITGQDTINSAQVKWKEFFTDPYLQALLDTAIKNNQELNIRLQEIIIAQNEIQARQGEYHPFVGLKGGAGAEKASKNTIQGATEDKIDIRDGKSNPDPLPDVYAGAYASWEIDIWHRLHNAAKASVNRYLASQEGKNFLVTNVIAEVANSYYELLALDNQMAIVKQNIGILNNALEIMRIQKEATRVTELAVRRFEAEVLKTKSIQYDLQQQITMTENKINFLLGRYPQHVARSSEGLTDMIPSEVHSGIPSQLLANRPDIRQAEFDLAAAKLDVKVAKARFYPSLGISASIGYQAFNPAYLISTPQSLFYSLAGDLAGPIVNKRAIRAQYQNANAQQLQAVYNYERTILNAFVEVANQLSSIDNLQKSYDLKSQRVQKLSESINISNDLFLSARADYMEVLLTQRDALESKFELVETKKQQMNAVVNIYRALGGGWK